MYPGISYKYKVCNAFGLCTTKDTLAIDSCMLKLFSDEHYLL